MATVEIISFGYGHGPAPEAHIVLDLRQHFRDPHVDPALRQLTAADRVVREAVYRTPGVMDLIEAATATVRAFLAGPTTAPVTVAVGCVGGRHRSAAVASAIDIRLRDHGITTQLHHRDIHQPVITR